MDDIEKMEMGGINILYLYGHQEHIREAIETIKQIQFNLKELKESSREIKECM